MKTKLKRSFGICLMTAMLTCISLVLAQTIQEYSFQNHYSSGSVKISLHQYQIDERGERVEVHNGVVQPGQKVSYIPEIRNERADCYVRIHVSMEMNDSTSEEEISVDNINAIGEDWIRIGDNFYRTQILKHGESCDAFEGIDIPSSWTQQNSNGGFTIRIIADAVQSDNFTPNFESAMPWGSIRIETEKEADMTDYCETVSTFRTPNELTITSEGGLESTTEDLFRNFSYFMAGDSCEDKLLVRNRSDSDVDLYFRILSHNNGLNEKTELIISNKSTVLYKSSNLHEQSRDWQKITHIKAGQTKKLIFSVYLPEDTEGEYAALNDDVIWQFRMKESERMSGDRRMIRTGDETWLMKWILILLLSLAALSVITDRRK